MPDPETSRAITIVTEQADPLRVLGSVFIISSLGGLAALLRSEKPLTKRLLFAAFLNSGIMGLVIALIWWKNYQDTNLYFLVGVSALAGLGGMTTLDLAFQYVRKKFGIQSGETAKPSNP